MSHDFAVLTPEAAGASDQDALAAAHVLFDQEDPAPEPDRRLGNFVVYLEAAGAVDEDTGWVSVWPLDVYDGGVARGADRGDRRRRQPPGGVDSRAT